MVLGGRSRIPTPGLVVADVRCRSLGRLSSASLPTSAGLWPVTRLGYADKRRVSGRGWSSSLDYRVAVLEKSGPRGVSRAFPSRGPAQKCATNISARAAARGGKCG